MTATALKQPDAPQKLITYEEYLEDFMSKRPTLQPYEIIEGVRHFMNTPLLIHQRIVIRLILLLSAYEVARRTGIVIVSPFDVLIRRIPRLQTRQPDVMFITNDRLELSGGIMMEGPLEQPPQLVIEVLSPSETRRIVQDKIEDYRSIGVEEAWLVSSQAETVQVLRLTAEGVESVAVYGFDESVTSLVFPDLTLSLADIFAY